MTIISVAVLSVLCVGVLVTVVIVLVVRVRRGWRRWRRWRNKASSTNSYEEAKMVTRAISSNSLSAHLLSTSGATQQFEWCRPRSISPASPFPPSLPPTPTPPPVPPHNPSPISHDYSEIASPTPDVFSVTYPPPPQRTHFYEEIVDSIVSERGLGCGSGGGANGGSGDGGSGGGANGGSGDGGSGGGANGGSGGMANGEERAHQYSILEDPTGGPEESMLPPLVSNQQSCDSSMSYQDGRTSIQELDGPQSSQGAGGSMSGTPNLNQEASCAEWTFSPACRSQHKQGPHRRVEPYRVSLILPSWEAGSRAPFNPSLVAAGRSPISSSCNALVEETGRYNHLQQGEGDYGSLEVEGMYATLEPFVKAEPISMRPRSRSCGARLYNHLQH